MSGKDFSKETIFYDWLEDCPLERWQTVEEKQYTDHVAVTVRLKVPKKRSMELYEDLSIKGYEQ